MPQESLSHEGAVQYHYGKFPPGELDYARLILPLSRATSAIARFDQMLQGMRNREILLAPLRRQEAIVSSRIEGTVTTLEELLEYEAEETDSDTESDKRYTTHRTQTIEVFLYGRAMRRAQSAIENGAPISSWVLRSAHEVLLQLGRGANLSPGEFKDAQNYLADRAKKKILFIPIAPALLDEGMEKLETYIQRTDLEPLIQTAITHVELEALHPFKDGNGRIGRMLIPLMLWKLGVLSSPHFYISWYLEQHRDEYIDSMREVSKSGAWTTWCEFFLNAIEVQANLNIETAEKIRSLYDELRPKFLELLSSKWHMNALDFVFSRPIFRGKQFSEESGIPAQTANRFIRVLLDAKILTVLQPPAGRRPGLYRFHPLLNTVRT